MNPLDIIVRPRTNLQPQAQPKSDENFLIRDTLPNGDFEVFCPRGCDMFTANLKLTGSCKNASTLDDGYHLICPHCGFTRGGKIQGMD